MQKLLTKSKFARLARVNPSTVTRLALTVLRRAMVGKQVDAAHPDAVSYVAKQDLNNAEPAAPGLDPRYQEVVDGCHAAGRYSIDFVRKNFHMGRARAKAIVLIMQAGGVVPAKNAPPPEPKAPHIRGHNAAKETKKRASLARVAEKLSDPEDKIFEIPEDIEAFVDMTLRELLQRFGTDSAFVDWLSATQKIEAINEKRLKNAQTKGTLISRELVKVGVIDVFNSAHLRLLKDGAKSIAAGVVSKHSGGAELSEVEAYVSDILGSFIRPVKNKIARVLKNA